MTDQEFIARCQVDGYVDIERKQQPANFTAQMHSHPFDARVFVTAGLMTLGRDDATRTFNPGEYCDVPAGQIHAEGWGPEGASVVVGRRHPKS
ncbi:MAG: hypothetical protein U1F52_22140 [Burkholderiales bacterium]